MNAIIKAVTPNSPASKTNIMPGDILRKINNIAINDYLDYEFCSYDDYVLLELLSPNKKIKLIQIYKPEGTDIGLEFESFLMDKERSCENNCIFCFIDQLPNGMRDTVYYKDDDFRLSFLQGNYITLTNLSNEDVERIIKLRISPINVSLHTLNPNLRSYMLGSEKGGKSLSAFNALIKAGITLNCQIVCCPGVNDGVELSRTIEQLMKMGKYINSVSIVPVGLTKHRHGLTELRPFEKELALKTIEQVERYGEICISSRDTRVFYCADELYMMAGLEIPENNFYDDYPQLENGVGMMRLFITEFEEAFSNNVLDNTESLSNEIEVSIATGVLAYPYLTNISNMISEKYDKIICNVYPIRNDYFGESVVVSGLITGTDLINQLKDKVLGSKLLIPQNMIRNMGTSNTTDDVFLDDVTVSEVSSALGVPVRIVKQDGADLLHHILNI